MVARGNDFIDNAGPASGNDVMYGNLGNDSVEGGNESNDTVFGGQGDDTVGGFGGNDLIYGNLGNDTIDGGNGSDTLFGGQGNDSLNGAGGSDIIYGNLGNDTIVGTSSGPDTMFGGQGNDVLFEQSGLDTTAGDLIFGNLGADTFDFTATNASGQTTATADRIGDFSTAQGDKITIDVTGAMEFATVTNASVNSVETAIAAAMGGFPSFDVIFATGPGTNGFLLVDQNDDGSFGSPTDFAIVLQNFTSLSASDIIAI
jgi:Ca2+-binding RTX toxin-like protein